MKIEGAERFAVLTRNFLGSDVKDNLARGIEAIARLAERGIKEVITSGASGWKKPPIDTGYMRNSVSLTEIGRDRAVITPEADYSVYVHQGTRFMNSRPFLPEGVKLYIAQIGQVAADVGTKISIGLVKR